VISSLLFMVMACGPKSDTVLIGLNNQNPAVRQDMVKIARRYDDPRVVKALAVALQDSEAVIRLSAVESLAQLDSSSAVPELIAALSDSNDKVRRAAVEALGKLADPRATDPLIAYVQERMGDRVPLNALWALGNIADIRALDLLSQLRTHSDPYVAYNAHQALRQLKPIAGQSSPSDVGGASEG
jgi:HEAT repeat protein